MLSLIFNKILSVNSRKLREGSVRFVINKMDVIERLIANGFLASSKNITAEDYVLSKFNIIEQYVSNACKQNRIGDVECEVVSFTKGTGVRDLITRLIKAHFSNLRIR